MLRWIVVLISVWIGAAPMARGADWFVRVDGNDLASGDSWVNGLATVTEALDRAVLSAGIDTIRVGEGRYLERILVPAGVSLLGGFDPSSGQQDPLQYVTTIDGRGAGTVVWFAAGADDSVLAGFVVQGGNGTGNGGGVACSNASPTIENNRIVGNRSAGNGSGIFTSGGSPVVRNNLIADNQAVGSGAGIYVTGGGPSILENIISGNVAGGDGGGLRIRDAAGVVVADNRILSNEAAGNGGGMEVVASTVDLTRNEFESNSAAGDGGALTARLASTVTASDCAFDRNRSGGHGGAVASRDSSSSFTRVELARNEAGKDGGAMRIRGGGFSIENGRMMRNQAAQSGGAIATTGLPGSLFNLELTRNQAQDDGGGLYAATDGTTAAPSDLSVVSCTFAMNRVLSVGAGIYVAGGSQVTAGDSIAWNNWGGLEIDGPGVAAADYSDIEEWNGTGIGDIVMDPLFVDGPFGSFYLGQTAALDPADSPCVDVGSRLASLAGLDDRATRRDSIPDSGTVDMGYHYPLPSGSWWADLLRGDDPSVGLPVYASAVVLPTTDPEKVLTVLDPPLLFYRYRQTRTIYLLKAGDTVTITF